MKLRNLFKRNKRDEWKDVPRTVETSIELPPVPQGKVVKLQHKQWLPEQPRTGVIKAMPRNLRQMKDASDTVDE